MDILRPPQLLTKWLQTSTTNSRTNSASVWQTHRRDRRPQSVAVFGEGLGAASKGPSMNPDRAGTGSADWKRMAHFVTNKGRVWGQGQGETGAHLSPDGAWWVVRQEENGPFGDKEAGPV